MSIKNSTRHFSVDHDYVLIYARDISRWKPNQVGASDKQRASYKNPDNNPKGLWQSISLSARNPYSKGLYAIRSPGGRVIDGPPAGSYWRVSSEKFWELHKQNEIWWGKDQNGMPRRKMYLDEQGELTKAPQTIWFFEDVGHTQDAKKEALAFNSKDVFATPKPERLMTRLIEIATNPGDLVLDSFAGSGTTGAVAHKMGRRWIMVELGEHCHTHIVPRLQKVIDGQDPGGVTQATGWLGGGGFRYYELAPTLLSTDRWGNLVINPAYDAAMLAAAMCKLEGFTYAPSEMLWWQQGYSSERDFIYVTTQTLSSEQLAALSEEVGADPLNTQSFSRSLLVCCGAYRGVTAAQAAQRWPNLTLKKIPKMVKDRCEWGHDDYSLNVANLPMAQKKVVAPAQDDLFGGDAA